MAYLQTSTVAIIWTALNNQLYQHSSHFKDTLLLYAHFIFYASWLINSFHVPVYEDNNCSFETSKLW
jgi:hypothetical protein